MTRQMLVPAHFVDEVTAAAERCGLELVPYDAAGATDGRADEVVAMFRWWLSADRGEALIRENPDLRWIHSGSAGVDHIVSPLLRTRRITLTTSAGVHADSIAEWAVGAILAQRKDFRAMYRQQTERRFEKVIRPELGGRRAVILGAGHIAKAIACRLRPFGVSVTALSRSGSHDDAFDEVRAASELTRQASSVDWLIVAAPLTAETRGIIGAEVIASMRSDATLLNVARGELVDEKALVEALQQNRIGGAILDVFEREPLPDDHPFWSMDQVMVLPHTTWRSPEVRAKQVALLVDNMQRFVRGDELLNVVDYERGY